MICRNIIYRTRSDIEIIKNEYSTWNPENILIQVFTGILDYHIIQKLQKELRELFPGTPVMGMSTAGEILNGESRNNSILISFSFFRTSRIKICLIDQNENLHEAGVRMGKTLSQEETKAAILFGCGLKNGKFINSEPLLGGLKESLGEVMIAGGQAGDNGIGHSTFVFTESVLTEHGAVGASLSGKELIARHAFNLSWIPIGKKLTISKAGGSHVQLIEDQTPYDLYSHYLGEDIARDLPLSGAEFPLMIERMGLQVAIHPLKIHPDGTFEYIHDFQEGEQVQFCYCNAGLLSLGAEQLRHRIVEMNPEALFIYSCVSRKWVLGADITMDLSSVKGRMQSAGCYCYGEYYTHDNSYAYMFSQTQTVLGLTEKTDETARLEELKKNELSAEESRQFRTMRVLHRLVETSTREIESMNRELVNLSRRDSLTTLANRRYFDERLKQEIKRHSRSRMPLSLILMDVDYFKNYNDTYGHVMGDQALMKLGKLIRSIVKRPDDLAARFGGEEFVCILSGTPKEGAAVVGKRIRQELEDLQILHSTSGISNVITISMGILTAYCHKDTAQAELLHKCDTLLYKAKKEGRNRIVQEDDI